MLLEYNQDGSAVRVLELQDPLDTRVEDEKKFHEMIERNFLEILAPGRAEKRYGRPVFSEPMQRRYFGLLARFGTTSKASAHTPISMHAVIRHRKASAAFRDSEYQAREAFADRLEDEMFRRSVLGTNRPVFFRGAVVGHVREYSDRLMELAVKGRRTEYREHGLSFNANMQGGVLVVGATPGGKEEDWARQHRQPSIPSGSGGEGTNGTHGNGSNHDVGRG